MALTRRQREVLNVVQEFIARNGYSPSLEEIGEALGLSSVATVHKHVTHLVEKGLVRRVWNQNRSIELVDSGETRLGVDVPLLGTISAGRPLDAVTTAETFRVPSDLVAGREKVFVLRVQGESMIDEQIRDGDYVVVEDRRSAKEGESVIALVDSSEATLKRFFRDGSKVKLQPANSSMTPIVLPAERVQVQGVVLALIRRY